MKTQPTRLTPLFDGAAPLALALMCLMLLAGCGRSDIAPPGQGARCGQGTILRDGVCLAEALGPQVECGAGTVLTDDGVCEAVEVTEPDGLRCGPGTERRDGLCVAVEVDGLVCGRNTREVSGICQADPCDRLQCGPGTRRSGDLCEAVPTDGLACGPRTRPDGAFCVVDVGPGCAPCGEGARFVDGACVGLELGLRCGEGTFEVDGFCEVEPTEPLVCGEGTRRVGQTCEALPGGLRCGPGTEQVVDVCVVADVPDPGDEEIVFEGGVELRSRADIEAIRDVNRITGELTVNTPGLEEVSLPNLREVGFGVRFFSPTLRQIRLPSLERTVRIELFEITALEVLDLSSLVELEGALALGGDTRLTALELPALERTNTEGVDNRTLVGFAVNGHSRLQRISAPLLRSTFSLDINNNVALEVLELPALREVPDRFQINNNPNYPACEGEALVEQLIQTPDTNQNPFAIGLNNNDTRATYL